MSHLVQNTLSTLPAELLDLILELTILYDPASTPRERQRDRITHTAVCKRWHHNRGIRSLKEIVLSTAEQITEFVQALRGLGDDVLAVTGMFLEMRSLEQRHLNNEVRYILEKSTNLTEIQLSLTRASGRTIMDMRGFVIGLGGLVKLRSVAFLGGLHFETDFIRFVRQIMMLKAYY